MNVYSCTLFYNEFDLLDLKISEELDVIDKMFIVESNQSFQANPKELLLENNEKYQHNKIELCFLRNKMYPKVNGVTPKNKNQKVQRNCIEEVVPYQDEDVLIVTDLDEINKKEDIENIVAQAKKYGCVRLAQRGYYYKINLARTTQRGWLGAFALTGKYLRKLKEEGLTLQDVRGNRQKLGTPIDTDGRHFSFLMSPELIAHKIKNFSHHEYNLEKFTDVKKIQKRIEEGIDPFDRKTSCGSLRTLFRVDIDESYPKTILNNLENWKQYIV